MNCGYSKSYLWRYYEVANHIWLLYLYQWRGIVHKKKIYKKSSAITWKNKFTLNKELKKFIYLEYIYNLEKLQKTPMNFHMFWNYFPEVQKLSINRIEISIFFNYILLLRISVKSSQKYQNIPIFYYLKNFIDWGV